jgi:HPt (histidine-containing phosphotransfer) domain-containing protein
MAELTKHFEQGEFDQVYQLAHKIKPNIDLFEIHELQGVVQMIEQHAVNGLTEDLGDNINTLTIVMEEVSKEMQASLDQ